jgi:NAD(P)H-nitrite reductase large subunit
LVDSYLRTSNPDIYAIGDCVELRQSQMNRRPIEAVWYTGRAMGQVVANNICNEKVPYTQDFWFNSAKFFDIEYQVYGFVPTKESEEIGSIFWQHPDQTKSIRIVFEKVSRKVIGFNLMGIRYRQEVCETWIKNEKKIEEIMPYLSSANFDPEFFEEYESEILKIFNEKYNSQLVSQGGRGLDSNRG